MTQILAAVGLMCILKYGSILDFVRRPLMKIDYFDDLFRCSLCLGFWSGAFVATYVYVMTGIIEPYTPFIAAAASWLFDTVIGTLQAVEAAHAKPDDQEDA